MPKKIFLFGWPATYSLSPSFQNHWIREAKIDAIYEVKPCPDKDNFLRTIRSLRSDPDFVGANVTNPYKVSALRCLDEKTKAVDEIGAANTLIWNHGRMYGQNTDALGFDMALKELGWNPRGKKVVVLGRGGVARAVVWSLKMRLPRRVTVMSRDSRQARACASLCPQGKGLTLSEENVSRVSMDADFVINALPMGEVSAKYGRCLAVRTDGPKAFDVNYLPQPRTDFIEQAQGLGWTCADGLMMLVGQGKLSFMRWFPKKRPDFSEGLFAVKRELKLRTAR